MAMDRYLARFRGVEPPSELRAKVLDAARRRSRDGWILAVAALVLILLISANAHLEGRVQALANGRMEAAAAREGNGETVVVDFIQSPLRSRLARRRTRRIGEQSWLKLRTDMNRAGIERSGGSSLRESESHDAGTKVQES